jgi:hypothetical protein
MEIEAGRATPAVMAAVERHTYLPEHRWAQLILPHVPTCVGDNRRLLHNSPPAEAKHAKLHISLNSVCVWAQIPLNPLRHQSYMCSPGVKECSCTHALRHLKPPQSCTAACTAIEKAHMPLEHSPHLGYMCLPEITEGSCTNALPPTPNRTNMHCGLPCGLLRASSSFAACTHLQYSTAPAQQPSHKHKQTTSNIVDNSSTALLVGLGYTSPDITEGSCTTALPPPPQSCKLHCKRGRQVRTWSKHLQEQLCPPDITEGSCTTALPPTPNTTKLHGGLHSLCESTHAAGPFATSKYPHLRSQKAPAQQPCHLLQTPQSCTLHLHGQNILQHMFQAPSTVLLVMLCPPDITEGSCTTALPPTPNTTKLHALFVWVTQPPMHVLSNVDDSPSYAMPT